MWKEDLQKRLDLMKRLNSITDFVWEYGRKRDKLFVDVDGKVIFVDVGEGEPSKIGSDFLPHDPIETNEEDLLSHFEFIKRELED